MRHLLAGLLMVLLFSTAGSAAPFAYIANSGDSTVSVIDIGANAVTATVRGLGAVPFGVAVAPDGMHVYVTNMGSNSLSVIDTTTNVVMATIPVGRAPFGVAIKPDGTRVYVANALDPSVSVIDTTTNSVSATVRVGMAGKMPIGLAVTPDGMHVYVTNRFGAPGVSVIDTGTNAVVAGIQVGDGPLGVAVSPNGQRIYVTNGFSNSVSVIDGTMNAVIAEVFVGGLPEGVAVNPAGTRVYVANSSSNSVSVIETMTYTIVAEIPVGVAPRGVAVTADGSRVYVADWRSNIVSVIDATNTSAPATSIAVGTLPITFGQFISRIRYVFSGFLAPVRSGGLTVREAGSTIPVKWRLTDAGKPVTSLSAIVAIQIGRMSCSGGTPSSVVDAMSMGTLRYRQSDADDDHEQEVEDNPESHTNATAGHYVFLWRSQESWEGHCYRLFLKLNDGAVYTTDFRFKD